MSNAKSLKAKGVKSDNALIQNEFSTVRYQLGPMKCPVCGRMGEVSFGRGDGAAIKHSGRFQETKYCRVQEVRRA